MSSADLSRRRSRRSRDHLAIEALEERQLLSAVPGAEQFDAPPPPPAVLGRYVFYNNSAFDGHTPGASPSDAAAIDTSKTAYLPGINAIAPGNMTNTPAGINGIIIELSGSHGPITAADFSVRMSGQLTAANTPPATWAAAPTPTVAVFSDAPSAGTDRIELIWPDGAIRDRYLEVIFAGDDATGGNNTNTGLAASDVFYFGNKVGDDFTSYAGFYNTDATDEIDVRNNQGLSLLPSGAFDFNKDYSVDATDQIAVRNNQGIMYALNVVAAGTVYVLHADGSRTQYPAAQDTDQARGTAFRTAATAAVAGETVMVGPGTYNIDAVRTAIYLNPGVTIKGSGNETTIIESGITGVDVNKSILVMNDNTTLEDFKFHGIAHDAYQRAIGSESLSVHNGVLRRIKIFSPNASDCFYDWGLSTSSYYLYDCDFRSGASAIKMLASGGGDTLYAENCYFEARGENYSGPENGVVILAYNKRSTQTFVNCQFVATNDANAFRTSGALIWGQWDGTTSLTNCTFYVAAPVNAVWDLDSALNHVITGTPEFIVSGGSGSGPGGAYVVSNPGDVTYVDADVTDATAAALAAASVEQPSVGRSSPRSAPAPAAPPADVRTRPLRPLQEAAATRGTRLTAAVDNVVAGLDLDAELLQRLIGRLKR